MPAFIAHGEARICLYLLAAPAGIVVIRPRWSPIALWIMWATMFGLLAVVIVLGDHDHLLPSKGRGLVAAATVLLSVIVPVVHRTPADPVSDPDIRDRIPEARVHDQQ